MILADVCLTFAVLACVPSSMPCLSHIVNPALTFYTITHVCVPYMAQIHTFIPAYLGACSVPCYVFDPAYMSVSILRVIHTPLSLLGVFIRSDVLAHIPPTLRHTSILSVHIHCVPCYAEPTCVRYGCLTVAASCARCAAYRVCGPIASARGILRGCGRNLTPEYSPFQSVPRERSYGA